MAFARSVMLMPPVKMRSEQGLIFREAAGHQLIKRQRPRSVICVMAGRTAVLLPVPGSSDS
jgi:hypothetical protein